MKKKFTILFMLILMGSKMLYSHQGYTHQWMLQQAYYLLEKQYVCAGGDIADLYDIRNHIFTSPWNMYWGNAPDLLNPWAASTGISVGAFREDEDDPMYDYLGLFSQNITMTHFWNADAGDNSVNILYNMTNLPNAWTKAQKYLFGNHMIYFKSYGLYFPELTHFGNYYTMPNIYTFYSTGYCVYNGYRGVNGQDFLQGNNGSYAITMLNPSRSLYAYQLLGRAIHLLGDMSVPAHVHIDAHACELANCDSYEQWASLQCFQSFFGDIGISNCFSGDGGFIPDEVDNPDFIRKLFYTMNQLADYFPSDDYPGNLGLGNGTNSIIQNKYSLWGWTNLSGVPPELKPVIAQRTVPFCIGATASLLYWFGVKTNQLQTRIKTKHIISNNTIWSDAAYHIVKDIHIDNNSTLSITGSQLSINPDNKIIIHPGSKLILDGCLLTNSCSNNKWQGIEVWGTKNAAQGSPFYSQYQGIVELKNGATIANAEEAIRLWNPNDWNSMGGIVFANNATFLNNRRSVEFMSYKETLPNGYTVDNESSFTNCTFKVDNNYLDPANDEFTVHVSLWDVKGVKFTACQFLNEISNKQFSLSNNKAIYSIDAAYYVNSLCSIAMPVGQNCPPENQTRSLFKGFNVAIEATGTNPNPFVKVDEADFKENLKGVRISSLNNSWINRSNFQVGNSSIQNIDPYYSITGIDLFNSTGFRVEENNLQASSLSNTTSNGIVVKQSGEAQNQVYKNTIQNLTYGQHYYYLNRSTQESYKGLQFLCNQHQGNAENDVMIEAYNGVDESVRIYQGRVSNTEEKAAGNTFSNGICNVKNETTIPLIYSCFSQPVQVPDINNCVNNNVFLTLLNTGNTCPSNFGTGLELPLSAEHKTMLNSNYDQLESAYTNLLYNYNTLIDGGNTNAVLNKIQSTWPQEVWKLRNELMSKSPYLTEEVLRETAKKNILPQAMVLEICLANPDGTRNHKFIDFLASEIPNPLPEYMLALIVDNWETKSTRTLLENTLAEKGAEKDYIANMLIANEQVSETSPKSFIRNWLTRRGNLPDFYARAESLMDENNYSSASGILSQISTYYKLDEVQQDEFNNFTTYLNFRSSIYNSGKSIAQLSKDEIEELKAIAAANTGRSSAIAKNILCFFYGVCFDDDVKTGGYKSRVVGKPTVSARQIINSEYNKVNVMPNPASVYTAFSWELPLLEGEATLTISDVSSKLIEQHTLKTRQGQWIWDTRAIKKGIYLYELKDATGSIAHGKLVISE